jgi:hypothetical protein
LTPNGSPDKLRNMKQGEPFVYLDPDEYDRMMQDNSNPVTWCTSIEGYWVQAVKPIVYDLEYRGLMDTEERMSTYIIWDLTVKADSGKL